MKMTPTNARPCELERGDLRRVPENTNHPVVAFHVCCARCGFVTIALLGYGGLEIEESEDHRLVTFSAPIRCAYCGVLIRDDDSQPYGTLCHYDFKLFQPRLSDAPLLQAVTLLVYRAAVAV